MAMGEGMAGTKKVTPRSNLGLSFAILLIVSAFATNSVITRFMVTNDLAQAFPLTVVRFLSGFIILLAISLAFPRSFSRSGFGKNNLVGGVLLASYGLAISFGYLFISAAVGTLIFYASVVLTMSIYSVIADRERLVKKEIVGLIVAVIGIFVLTSGGDSSVTILGVTLMMVTGVSWGAYSVYGRRFTSSFGYTFYSFAILLVIIVPAQLLLNPRTLLDIPISVNGLGLALFFGMITTALSYVLWHKALTKIKASQGGVFQMFVPIIAAAMGVTLLAEDVTISLIVGGAMILVGIYLNS